LLCGRRAPDADVDVDLALIARELRAVRRRDVREQRQSSIDALDRDDRARMHRDDVGRDAPRAALSLGHARDVDRGSVGDGGDEAVNARPRRDLLDDLAPSGAAAIDVLDEAGEGLEFALDAVRHALGVRLHHQPGDIDARCQGAALRKLLVALALVRDEVRARAGATPNRTTALVDRRPRQRSSAQRERGRRGVVDAAVVRVTEIAPVVAALVVSLDRHGLVSRIARYRRASIAWLSLSSGSSLGPPPLARYW
jgi:hypothetical protein